MVDQNNKDGATSSTAGTQDGNLFPDVKAKSFVNAQDAYKGAAGYGHQQADAILPKEAYNRELSDVNTGEEEPVKRKKNKKEVHKVPEVHAKQLFTPHEVCEGAVEYVLQNVNTVQYLLRSIEDITLSAFQRGRIKCLPLTPTMGGAQSASEMNPDRVFAGYMWRNARADCHAKDIVLLEDHVARLFRDSSADAFLKKKVESIAPSTIDAMSSAEPQSSLPPPPLLRSAQLLEELLVNTQHAVLAQVERNIRHELIHAFDDARGELEAGDCVHQACSEIRAARLSGDCFVGQEMRKGRFNLFEGGQRCVRRRAAMALDRNPVCRGFSDRAVESMMPKCYSDYEPFAAPIYSLGSYGETRFGNGTLSL